MNKNFEKSRKYEENLNMTKPNNLSKIDHFVVLMLENRSFDQMLGYLYTEQGNVSPLGHPYEGLTGNETNIDSKGNAVKVFKIDPNAKYAYYMPGADPGEGYYNTNGQLFGQNNVNDPGKKADNSGFIRNFEYSLNWEAKDKWSILPGTQPSDIMGMYHDKMLPVLSQLAKSYAVCDHWYCSAPTETLPNRAFLAMATSQGRLTDKNNTYTAPTMFNYMGSQGHSWSIYGYNNPPLSRASYTDITNADKSHFGIFSDFVKAVDDKSLAEYVFLEPDWGKGGNSQHPNYNVARGEEFILEVYNTLRHSKIWDKTMLIITYDEHGGCYDHVAPPTNATPPDNTTGEFGFDFSRFGVRVPAVLVSPYIESGSVFRVPEGATPLDHTSILKTIQQRFDLDPLTKRDAAAHGLGDVLTLNEPRQDYPLKNTKAPETTSIINDNDEPDHLQELYAHVMHGLPVKDKHGNMAVQEAPLPQFKSGKEAMEYSEGRYHEYFNKLN